MILISSRVDFYLKKIVDRCGTFTVLRMLVYDMERSKIEEIEVKWSLGFSH